MNIRGAIVTGIFIIITGHLQSQETINVSGSFESNTHYYLDDEIPGYAPLNRIASNNWLWVQLSIGSFRAGLQYEAYIPPLAGYPYQLEGYKISHRFLEFSKGIIQVTGGNFYDQFGSGLSFRAYEDRFLGINSSLDGIRIVLNPLEAFKLKAIYGKQRKYLESADSYIRGIDGEISVSSLLKMESRLSFGAGIVSKYELYTGPDDSFPSVVNAGNARLTLNTNRISINTEFVYKTDDPSLFMNNLEQIPGKAFKSNISYASNGLAIFISGRFLDNMYFLNERNSDDGYSAINYLPANSRQHTYLLSNLYPFTTQSEAESSVQADLYYSISRNTLIGGKYGTRLRLNYSVSKNLDIVNSNNRLISFGEKLLFQDLNLEVNRRWNRNFRSVLLFQNCKYNQDAIEFGGDNLVHYNAVIADLRYSFSNRFSVKTELQHLWTNQDHGNWYAFRFEISIAPILSFYVYDLSDYEYSTQIHYLNTGVRLNLQHLNLGIGWGRNREGYICSGGICRKVPAYRGLSLNITSSF